MNPDQTELLDDVLGYFESMIDVTDGDDGKPQPNEAFLFSRRLRHLFPEVVS